MQAMKYRTGKLPPKPHPNTLYLARYLAPGTLPDSARKVYREYKVPDAGKQMFGNDRYGDCVWAMIANYLVLTSCHTGKLWIPSLNAVLKGYSDVTGFDPETGANDNGTVMTEAFEYMRTTGIAGHRILGWAKIDHTNPVHRHLGVDLFGATCTGVRLPDDAQDQFEAGGPWELVQPPNPNEGHAILHSGYGSEGGNYESWARVDQKASTAWENACIDEEYILITPEWFDAAGWTPGGLNLKTLEADLKLLSV